MVLHQADSLLRSGIEFVIFHHDLANFHAEQNSVFTATSLLS